MLNARMPRTAPAWAAALLLCACGGREGENGESSSTKRDGVDGGGTAAVSRSAGDSITVVFQVTGLLLVVPPGGDGRHTRVLMPRVSKHNARLGFGAERSAVCKEYRGGICYVDLQDWTVEPIRSGGAPPSPQNVQLPAHVANVTHGSGGEYRVRIDSIREQLRAAVVFQSGAFSRDYCSLARWQYTPVNAAGKKQSPRTLDIPNVLYWSIRVHADSQFKLRFTQRRRAPVEVPLRAVSNDSILVLLGHVPDAEMPFLPPAEASAAKGEPAGELTHFHDFYNLLRKPGHGMPQGTHRPLPLAVASIPPKMCRVRITTTAQRVAPMGMGGIKTYGCVTASGEG